MAVVVMLLVALSLGAPSVSADSGSVALTNGEVTPFAMEEVGGGWWDYGTRVSVIPPGQIVWSDYFHSTKVHGSSCKIGASAADSGWIAAGQWSYSNAVGAVWETGYAWWRTQD